jgi:tetratricopeptide (TPR) repeat protein
MIHPIHNPLPAALILLLSIPTLADTVVLKNISFDNVRITDIRVDEIFFTINSSNREIKKSLIQVTRINITDEPALNAAEDAYEARDWEKAAEAYEKSLRSTQRPWLHNWSSVRLLDSASKSGRFDLAIRTVISLAESSPETARSINLPMPKPDSAYIPEAINTLNAALKNTKKDATREILLNLLVELQNARGDSSAANEALQRRLDIRAADPNSPQAAKAAAILKLKTIRLALGSKEFDKVIQIIENDSASLTDPSDQAEAIFLLAEARAAKAAASNSPDTWKDVALSYMRVASNAPAGSPFVPASLFKTAEILEHRLKEPQTALLLYQQIAADFKGHDAAKEAEKHVARLKTK